jgi:hypothetical protein
MNRTMIVIPFIVLAFCLSIPVPHQAFAEEAMTPPETGQQSFTVKRLVIAGQIEGREPAGVSDSFPSTTEGVYCFLEAVDIEKDTEVTFTWQFENSPVFIITLPLKRGPRWRTYSYKNLYGMAGDWKVELKDAGGYTVDTVSFTVK